MKRTSLLLAAACLAPAAFGGDVTVRADVTVTSITGPGLQDPTLAALQVGDTMQFSYEVNLATSMPGPNGTEYTLNFAESEVRIGTTVVSAMSTQGPGCTLHDDMLDLFICTMSLPGGANALSGMFDPNGGLLSSEDLSALIGAPLPSGGSLVEVAYISDMNTNVECSLTQLEVFSSGPAPLATFCDPNNANSTGGSTTLSGVLGTGVQSGLRLDVSGGVPAEFGYFLIGSSFNEPGTTISDGRLCLTLGGGNQIGRYNFGSTTRSIGSFDGAGNFRNLSGTATSNGGFGYDVASATPMGGTITSGSTWHFQLWHRDTAAGAGNSNFSNGVSVTFP